MREICYNHIAYWFISVRMIKGVSNSIHDQNLIRQVGHDSISPWTNGKGAGIDMAVCEWGVSFTTTQGRCCVSWFFRSKLYQSFSCIDYHILSSHRIHSHNTRNLKIKLWKTCRFPKEIYIL